MRPPTVRLHRTLFDEFQRSRASPMLQNETRAASSYHEAKGTKTARFTASMTFTRAVLPTQGTVRRHSHEKATITHRRAQSARAVGQNAENVGSRGAPRRTGNPPTRRCAHCKRTPHQEQRQAGRDGAKDSFSTDETPGRAKKDSFSTDETPGRAKKTAKKTESVLSRPSNRKDRKTESQARAKDRFYEGVVLASTAQPIVMWRVPRAMATTSSVALRG